jgi:hypothetical protein
VFLVLTVQHISVIEWTDFIHFMHMWATSIIIEFQHEWHIQIWVHFLFVKYQQHNQMISIYVIYWILIIYWVQTKCYNKLQSRLTRSTAPNWKGSTPLHPPEDGDEPVSETSWSIERKWMTDVVHRHSNLVHHVPLSKSFQAYLQPLSNTDIYKTLTACNMNILYHPLCRIWGFHSGDYEECHLLGCGTMSVL